MREKSANFFQRGGVGSELAIWTTGEKELEGLPTGRHGGKHVAFDEHCH
jgi:hypothetical protein